MVTVLEPQVTRAWRERLGLGNAGSMNCGSKASLIAGLPQLFQFDPSHVIPSAAGQIYSLAAPSHLGSRRIADGQLETRRLIERHRLSRRQRPSPDLTALRVEHFYPGRLGDGQKGIQFGDIARPCCCSRYPMYRLNDG